MSVPYFLLLLATELVMEARGQNYCYSTDPDPYDFHAEFSGYFPVQNENSDPITFDGCTPLSLWLFSRHGSRNPSEEDILEFTERGAEIQEQVAQNHQDGNGGLCQEDLDLLASWTQDLTLDQAEQLTASGAAEQEGLGRKFRERFPDLFEELLYDQERVRVRHTDYQRTERSAEAFVAGVFPGEDVFIPEPLEDDPLLRFYDSCTKWQEEVAENPETGEQQDLFVSDSSEVAETVGKVNDRLGFAEGAVDRLAFEDVATLFDICRMDRSRRPGRPSPWCVAFDKDDLPVMEYYRDIYYWYEASYGSEINRDIACPLINDMAEIFNSDSDSMILGTFYFGHYDAVAMLLTTLGLFEDATPLLYDNFDASADRLYRSSLLDSFSGNFEFALYECDEGDGEPTRRLLALQNEEEVELPGCDDSLCDWEQFLQLYQDAVQCDFDAICENI